MGYPFLRRDCWLEIDLDKVAENFNAMRALVGNDVKIMPAVKANAYGHGIVACCKELERCGADYLGVGNIDEAIELRETGVKMPLLVFASNQIVDQVPLYLDYHLIPTVLRVEQAEALSAAANGEVPIFIKIDTGRGRLGVNAEKFPAFFQKVSALPHIRVEGVYSHMCASNWPDKDTTGGYALWQYDRFRKAMDGIGEAAERIPFRQLANTPAAIAYPQLRMSGICPGRAIWGFSPLEKREGHPELHYPMTAWKSRIVHVNEVIGGKFGENFKAKTLEAPRRIGVMPGGLSDGVHPEQVKGCVLVRGKRVPVQSSICLEHTILDLTNFPEVQPGDEVVIFGRQGDEEITLDELRNFWGKSLETFWTGITPHVQRVYFKNGKPVAYTNGDKLTEL